MTVMYVTKYGLTQGILKIEGRKANDMFIYKAKGQFFAQYAHGLGKDFHETLEEAQARVGAMASKKVASCKKTIKKLEAYVPAVIEG